MCRGGCARGAPSGRRNRGRSEDLGQWVPRVTKLYKEADRTHILMNNCYRDFATTNATELSELLRASGLEVLEGPKPAC